MDNSVQIEDDVGVEVVYCVDSKQPSRSLDVVDVGEGVGLEWPEEVDGLLVVVVFGQLVNEAVDLYLLLLDQLVDHSLHPSEVGVDVPPLEGFDVAAFLDKVVLGLELVPELFAPFG